nr:zinc finger, CCHC-type [Tanacetum cinerariifolium]
MHDILMNNPGDAFSESRFIVNGLVLEDMHHALGLNTSRNRGSGLSEETILEHLQVITPKAKFGKENKGQKEEIDTCAICYGEYEENKKIGKLQCGHLFHMDCIKNWLSPNGLWETIEPNEKTQADNRKDKTAITFLYQALPEDQLLQITKHKTTKSIWDSLKTRHIGEERVQQARLQTLKSDFEMLHMKEDETIDTFTTKLTTLVNKAASLGHTMEDETLVHKLLNDIPDRYLQIVVSIEQYSDLSEMTLEEAIGRLKTYEERIKYKKGKQVDNQEKLMFTRHENNGKYFRGRGRVKHKFSQRRNHENFKEERKDEETSHRS